MSKYKIPGGPQWDDAPGSWRDPERDLPALFTVAVMLAQTLRLSRWPRDAVRALLRHAAAEPFDDPTVMVTTFLLPPEPSVGARRPAVTLGHLLGLALYHEDIDPADPLDGRWRDRVRGVVERAIEAMPSSPAAVTLDPEGWLRYLGFKFTLAWPIEKASELLRAVGNDPCGVPAGFRAYVVPAPSGGPGQPRGSAFPGPCKPTLRGQARPDRAGPGRRSAGGPEAHDGRVDSASDEMKTGARLSTAGPLLRQAFLYRSPRGLWGPKEDSNVISGFREGEPRAASEC
jgi:hypothetical protein